MSTEQEVKLLAEKVAAAQAIVVAKRKSGSAEDLEEAKTDWNEAVEAYDKAVDAWAEAGFPKSA